MSRASELLWSSAEPRQRLNRVRSGALEHGAGGRRAAFPVAANAKMKHLTQGWRVRITAIHKPLTHTHT